MGVLRSSPAMCPRDANCSEWARQYMKYCLCDAKDGVSLFLGLVSVISWGVAEIPQIMTSYKQKSAEGLSIAFLMTWILGDLFNVFGCMLEPATLPTQFYMALLYTVTTLILTSQTIYYGHIYNRFRSNQQSLKPSDDDAVEKRRPYTNGINNRRENNTGGRRNETVTIETEGAQSLPIPLPGFHGNDSLERESYYMSARSLSKSHTPPVGSFLSQMMISAPAYRRISLEEPFLSENESQSAPPSKTKTMLCVFSAVSFFLGTLNLHLTERSMHNMVFEKPGQGVIIPVGRRLLQASENVLLKSGGSGSSGVGTYLGWAMAIIYMGGRLPQIWLNIRRGNVKGLNPLMFVFALVGNATYVASILVSSLEWSKISANLPWLVDAGGCVVLDTFILFQFIYFRTRDVTVKRQGSSY